MFSHVSVHPSIHQSVHTGVGGGTPPWVPRPGPARGGTPTRSSPGGVPHLGYSPWTWLGGYPTSGTTPVGPGGGGVPHFGKQMEYLIRRGRYASSVHAGGLSCYTYKVLIDCSGKQWPVISINTGNMVFAVSLRGVIRFHILLRGVRRNYVSSSPYSIGR